METIVHPKSVRSASVEKDFRISVLTPMGEVSRDFTVSEVFEIRYLAIASKAFMIPHYKGGFTQEHAIVSKYWCKTNDPQFAELWLARNIAKNPHYANYGLSLSLKDLRVSSFKVESFQIVQIQSSEFLTRIDIVLKRLRHDRKPFGVRDVAKASGYETNELMNALTADPILRSKVNSAIDLSAEWGQNG